MSPPDQSLLRQFYFSSSDLKLPCLANLPSSSSSSSSTGSVRPVSPNKANALQRTQFDKEFVAAWQDHMRNGSFRYNLDGVEGKLLKGKHRFVAQLNPNRASNRRAPQAMLHLEQPFSHDKFNFTKINLDKEGIFELKAMEKGAKQQNKNTVIINVSPLEFGASLLLPFLDQCLPQILTKSSIRLAMETVLLSGVPNFKAAFNSLCAYASVNHLHWHLYYLQDHSLKLETLPVHRFSGDCYEVREDDYPAAGYAFQVRRLSDLDHVADCVYRLTSYLVRENVGHNVFVTRGSSFENFDSGRADALRVFVWAREKLVGTKDAGAFVVAVCELAGHILCYDEARYGALEEEEVSAALRGACAGVKARVDGDVRKIFGRK